MTDPGGGPVALACLATLALAGCTVSGEVDIGTDTITMDLDLSSPAEEGTQACDEASLPPGFTVSRRQVTDTGVSCSVTGSVPLHEMSWVQFLVQEVDGTVFLVVPRAGFGDGQDAVYVELDITVNFPGRVLAASAGGQVEGTRVRWTDFAAVRDHGLAATATTRPLVAERLVPAAMGTALGAAAGLGGVLGWRRWRQHRAAASASGPGLPEPLAAVPSTLPDPEPPVPPEDPEVWSRP